MTTDGPVRSLSTTIGRQSALTLAALVANGLARIFGSLLVGRVTGPVSLGVFQSGLSAAQLAGLFGPAALGAAASTFVARLRAHDEPATVRAAESHLVLRTLQSSALVVLVASIIGGPVTGRGPLEGLAFAALTASFCWYSFTRGHLYGAGRANRAALWNIVQSVLGVAVVGAGVALGVHGSWLLALFSTSYFVFAAANRTRARPRKLETALGHEIDRFTLYAILGTLASTGFLEGTMVTAAAVGEPAEVGHFSAAFVLAMPASLIGASASLVLFPVLSQLHADTTRDSRTRVVDLCSRTLALVVVGLFATLLLLRVEIVQVIWGPEYAASAALLVPLLFALMVNTLAIPAVNALTTSSAQGVKLAARSSLVGLVVGLLGWLVLVPHIGIAGVAYGFLLGTTVSSVMPFVLTWRLTTQAWARHAGLIVGATLVLAAVCYAQVEAGTSTVVNVGVLAVFLGAWLLLNVPEVRLLWGVGRKAIRRS